MVRDRDHRQHIGVGAKAMEEAEEVGFQTKRGEGGQVQKGRLRCLRLDQNAAFKQGEVGIIPPSAFRRTL
jgi:hypothetical protein